VHEDARPDSDVDVLVSRRGVEQSQNLLRREEILNSAEVVFREAA